MDIQLFASCEQDPCFDFQVINGDLSSANELNNAVMISLFTDKRAKDDDVLPSGQTDRRGWWADALDGEEIGSRLWLLYDERRLPKVLLRAEEYAKEALNWLITDKVVKSINIVASMDGRCETLFISVEICRPSLQTEKYKYQYVWGSLQGNNCHVSEDYPYNTIHPVVAHLPLRVTTDSTYRRLTDGRIRRIAL
jgi:phage gp46-like protein